MFEDGYNYAWSKHVLHGKDREERLLGSKRRVFKVTKNNVGCTVCGWYSSLPGLSTFHNHLQFYINRLPIKVVRILPPFKSYQGSKDSSGTKLPVHAFLCGIHPRPWKENVGQGSFGVLKTSFSILKRSFTIFENQFLHLWKDFSDLCLKNFIFLHFSKNFVNSNGIKRVTPFKFFSKIHQ